MGNKDPRSQLALFWILIFSPTVNEEEEEEKVEEEQGREIIISFILKIQLEVEN